MLHLCILIIQVRVILRKTDVLTTSSHHQSWQINKYITCHSVLHLFGKRLLMTSKCSKNKTIAHRVQLRVSRMFLPHLGICCALLLYRATATWNWFVLYMYGKERKMLSLLRSPMYLPSNRSAYHISLPRQWLLLRVSQW